MFKDAQVANTIIKIGRIDFDDFHLLVKQVNDSEEPQGQQQTLNMIPRIPESMMTLPKSDSLGVGLSRVGPGSTRRPTEQVVDPGLVNIQTLPQVVAVNPRVPELNQISRDAPLNPKLRAKSTIQILQF